MSKTQHAKRKRNSFEKKYIIANKNWRITLFE